MNMFSPKLLFVIIFIYYRFLRKKTNKEHFMGPLAFAKKANKLRKILLKFNKMFKRTKQIKKASDEVPKKVEAETNKQVAEFEKDINNTVKESGKDLAKQQNTNTGVKTKKKSRQLLEPLKNSIAKMFNMVKKVMKKIFIFIKKLGDRIVELLFSPFKNIKRHFSVKHGKVILFGSAFLVIILGTFSDSIAYLMDLQGNLIVTAIINFIGSFIITFLAFAMKMKGACKVKSIPQLMNRIPIKTLLKTSLAVSGSTIITSYQIFGAFLGVINKILANFGDIVQKVAAIKESLILGVVYLITTLMTAIPKCRPYLK